MNEWKKGKKKTKAEEKPEGNEPVFSFGLYITIYRVSRVLRLLCTALSIMLKESYVARCGYWLIGTWWSISMLGKSTLGLPNGASNAQFLTDQTFISINYPRSSKEALKVFLCVWKKIELLMKIFLNTILRSKCGNRFWVRLVISFFLFYMKYDQDKKKRCI